MKKRPKTFLSLYVVDDATFVRELIFESLVKKPEFDAVQIRFNVEGEATLAQEVLDHLYDIDANVFLIDTDLPDASGWSVIRQINEVHPDAYIILMCDGLNPTKHPEEETLSSLIFDVLEKPFQPSYFWRLLDKMALDSVKEDVEAQEVKSGLFGFKRRDKKAMPEPETEPEDKLTDSPATAVWEPPVQKLAGLQTPTAKLFQADVETRLSVTKAVVAPVVAISPVATLPALPPITPQAEAAFQARPEETVLEMPAPATVPELTEETVFSLEDSCPEAKGVATNSINNVLLPEEPYRQSEETDLFLLEDDSETLEEVTEEQVEAKSQPLVDDKPVIVELDTNEPEEEVILTSQAKTTEPPTKLEAEDPFILEREGEQVEAPLASDIPEWIMFDEPEEEDSWLFTPEEAAVTPATNELEPKQGEIEAENDTTSTAPHAVEPEGKESITPTESLPALAPVETSPVETTSAFVAEEFATIEDEIFDLTLDEEEEEAPFVNDVTFSPAIPPISSEVPQAPSVMQSEYHTPLSAYDKETKSLDDSPVSLPSFNNMDLPVVIAPLTPPKRQTPGQRSVTNQPERVAPVSPKKRKGFGRKN